MNYRHSLLTVIPALALLSMPALSQTAKPGALRAGAAKVDITPQPSDLKVSTDSIRDHLFARVIALDNGNTCAVLVGLDLGGARDNIVEDAIHRASASTKCPAENFIISATHTHSSNTGGLGGAGAPTAETVANAIVSAVETAYSHLAPARVGFGRTKVDLNVNRDLFNSKLEWRQQANPEGASDKTLAVIEFIGQDYVPIGVYMNYAMHPINFYLSGVISADFPGEASRFIESEFEDKTVAIFSQGTSGDQNPLYREGGINPARQGRYRGETIGAPPPPPEDTSGKGFNPAAAQAGLKAVSPENMPAYQKAIARTSATVTMMGALIAEATLQVMRTQIQPVDSALIWGGEEKFTCPGRQRLDAANPARENVFPGYKDGADVNLRVGLLRIGDINLVAVNGEVYTNIGLRIKANSPASKTVIVTLANGAANSGYIYSDDAYSHLTFQVIGSRLKPGCAEGKITAAALDLMHQSGE